MFDTAQLLPRHRLQALQCLQRLQDARIWRGDLPVLVLDRCWLRLDEVPIDDLCRHLPPDASREAPELARYRELQGLGLPGLEAQQQCWAEFGVEACQEAQRRFWSACEQGRRLWCLEDFLDLYGTYRRRFAASQPRPLPLLVLARSGDPGPEVRHQLRWLEPADVLDDRSMRHTCP